MTDVWPLVLVGSASAVSVPGLAVVRARFSLDRMNAQDAERERGDGPAYTLRRLREVADLTEVTGPLVSLLTVLADPPGVVHRVLVVPDVLRQPFPGGLPRRSGRKT